MPLPTLNWQTETKSIGQTKHAAESHEYKLSNKPSNVENTQDWARTNLGNMQPSYCTAMPLPPWIGERKRSRSARWSTFIKAMMIRFRMSHWTRKTAQNWVRNIPTICTPSSSPPCSSDLGLANENSVDRRNETCSWNLRWSAFEWAAEHQKRPKIGWGTNQYI